jgi:hypothetical protein
VLLAFSWPGDGRARRPHGCAANILIERQVRVVDELPYEAICFCADDSPGGHSVILEPMGEWRTNDPSTELRYYFDGVVLGSEHLVVHL